MKVSIYIIIGLMLCHKSSSSIFEWFGWKSSEELPTSTLPLLKIPFEELGPEDKFLVEANKITGLKLSQLDACQHKLIMKIKASCGTLSDEELSKLSVNLLNCQADVEGRKTFPCTENMSLRDCTSDMDSDSWNSYHIMSNRARAVCYAARQEQFRALAEMTVNRLVASARTHIEQMAVLNANQEKLEKATGIALERISRSQHDVLSTYSHLRRLESDFAASLIKDKTGLEEVGTLINSERDKIARIVTDFKAALEETGKEFNKQKKLKSMEHEKVLKDLAQVQQLTHGIDKQLREFQLMNDDNFLKSSSQFNDTFKLLSAMNKSLHEISSKLLILEKITDEKTSKIFYYFGKNGENIDIIILAAVHFVCISFAMIICSFLELPRHVRAVTIAAAVINVYLSITENEHSLQLPLLYLSLALFTFVDLAVLQIYRIYKRRKLGKEKMFRNDIYKSSKPNGLQKPEGKVNEWLKEKFPDLGLRNGGFVHSAIPKDYDEASVCSRTSLRSRKKGTSPAHSVAESSASDKKSICSAICLNGLRCKLLSTPGRTTCRVHSNSR